MSGDYTKEKFLKYSDSVMVLDFLNCFLEQTKRKIFPRIYYAEFAYY